ncbi:MAG: phosphatidylglycerol lysyltransferase domain-containing protein [Acidimicrobiales bacterium]
MSDLSLAARGVVGISGTEELEEVLLVPESQTDPRTIEAEIGIGRRVVVLANLGLAPDASPVSLQAGSVVADALDSWQGPGTVVIAGNFLDLRRCQDADSGVTAQPDADASTTKQALDTHSRLSKSLRDFASGPERRLICLPGSTDSAIQTDPQVRAAIEKLGANVAPAVDLVCETTAGAKRVRVLPGPVSGAKGDDFATSPEPEPEVGWQGGMDRLADASALERLVKSRTVYRWLSGHAWLFAIPFLIVLVLSLPATSWVFSHVLPTHPGPVKALHRVRDTRLGARLLVAVLVAIVEIAAAGIVLLFVGRRRWSRVGGERLERVFGFDEFHSGATGNDEARDTATALVSAGYAGVVSGATLQAELTHLGTGFFACPGTAGEVVEEYPGRMGLPPVFLAHRQVAWVELETGADLHARLLLARSDIPAATLLERIAARHHAEHETTPVVVAAHPSGGSWPPAPDLSSTRRRSRRARRLASVSIAIAGLLDLITSVTPPLRSHLHLVRQVLPLGATQAAGALVALAGLGLLALARGVRRGQHRAWAISVGVLASTLVLHIARGADITAWVVSAVVLAILLVFRQEFQGASDRPSLRSAIIALVGGVVGITIVATIAAQIAMLLHHDRRVSFWTTGEAVAERLVGVQTIVLPKGLNGFLAPSLATIGVSLAAIALWLATRPVVDRHTTGRSAEARARDIVRRHGAGTLDYFALRSDKKRFFHRDSVVAYAIYGGVCLVSPDPIGPLTERAQTWAAFRRFADSRGWVLAIMGASEEWLPIYRATGMHEIYIGDEAVVDVQKFSLAGGHMKGLRQAANRIAKYGYTATFHDPATLDQTTGAKLATLMAQSRRGEMERGFSMTLGRIFDPRDEGLVLCAVWAPDGTPAAMCQFVRASGIGGYSLDLMRRDRGEHPNGLVDFALVSTIEYLREKGARGLSLNFAAMRSILDGERGDGVAQRVERWALKKMSSFLQIETLWRFNSKYGPSWIPRYIVYDTPEHLVPAVLAILRAESLWEVPVIGKMLGAAERRIHTDPEDPVSQRIGTEDLA